MEHYICIYTQWRSWIRHCATSRKVAVSIPDCIIGIFHWHNSSGRTMVMWLTQPLSEMSTRNISWEVKVAGVWGWPQSFGTLRACPGFVYGLTYTYMHHNLLHPLCSWPGYGPYLSVTCLVSTTSIASAKISVKNKIIFFFSIYFSFVDNCFLFEVLYG
jgi:hypothetical protein